MLPITYQPLLNRDFIVTQKGEEGLFHWQSVGHVFGGRVESCLGLAEHAMAIEHAQDALNQIYDDLSDAIEDLSVLSFDLMTETETPIIAKLKAYVEKGGDAS